MTSTNSKSPFDSLKPLVSVVVGAIVLLIPAFNNRFPFLYADTATYIMGGFKGAVSDYRPITYGIFIRHASLMESLWLVVFLQALIVSWLIHLFLRVFSKDSPGFMPLAWIALLTFTTHIGTSVGMLMPDFLTSALILATGTLLYGETLRRREVWFLGVIVWFGLSSHYSHHFIELLTLLGITVFWLWGHFWKKQRFQWRRLATVYGLLTLAYFTIPTLHYVHGGGFIRDKAAHVFLVGRLNQMGLLKPFLDEHCGKTGDWNLCIYKDSLPDNFLWSPQSPVYRTGGWAANQTEYNRFLNAFFHSPPYVKKFCIKTFETAILQFFNYEGDIIFKEREGNPPFDAIREVLPDQIPAIRLSEQYQEIWSNKVLDVVQRFTVIAGFLFLLYFLWAPERWHLPVQKVRLIGFLFLALGANALVCGGGSMVDMRFQARVIWLVPLNAMWLLWSLKPWQWLRKEAPQA